MQSFSLKFGWISQFVTLYFLLIIIRMLIATLHQSTLLICRQFWVTLSNLLARTAGTHGSWRTRLIVEKLSLQRDNYHLRAYEYMYTNALHVYVYSRASIILQQSFKTFYREMSPARSIK